MIILQLIALVMILGGGWLAASGLYAKWNHHAASIAIIGGADGPTSIFVAGKVGSQLFVLEVIVGILLIAVGLLFCWFIKRKKK